MNVHTALCTELCAHDGHGARSIDVRFVAQAFQNCHAPLEAPDAYVEKYPEDWRDDRRWYAGMVNYWVHIHPLLPAPSSAVEA